MAFYVWKGIDIQADDQKGISQAHSIDELDKKLLSKGISILSAQVYSVYYPTRVWRAVRHEWFVHLAHLLDAGIRLPQALELIHIHESNKHLKIIWHDIAQELLYGESLVSALQAHRALFDPLVSQLLAAAHETSELHSCLLHIARYYTSLHIWKKELQANLAGPVMTFMVCVGVSLFIFIVMLPLFESFFDNVDRKMNTISHILFSISSWLRCWGLFSTLLCLGLATALTIVYKKSVRLHCLVHRLLEKLPFIGYILKNIAIYQLLKVLSLLLEAHASLKSSFELIIKHHYVQGSIHVVISQLYACLLQGQSLADCCEQYPFYFNPEIIAYMRMGQESAQLPVMLRKASEVSYSNAVKRLGYISCYIQPILLFLIGALISLLIVSVYMPIINLAYAIG